MQANPSENTTQKLSTSAQVKSQLLNKLSKKSLVIRERVRTQEKVDPNKTIENKRYKGLVEQFEVDLSSKNINALQSMLENKRSDNEILRNELKEIEKQIKQAEAQIRLKQKDSSQSKLSKLPKITNSEAQNEIVETRQHLTDLNKQISAKSKNLKEYEKKLGSIKTDFDRLPADTKKILVQQLNKDQKFAKYLKEDAFLRMFFNNSDSSLEY